jgi:hypothetical protein
MQPGSLLSKVQDNLNKHLRTPQIEFEELILTGAPIEISGFSLDEVDQIILNLDQVPKVWCRWLLAQVECISQVECILCLGPETINGQTWLLAANPLYNVTHGAQVQFLP